MKVGVHRLSMDNPGDVSGLRRLLQDGAIDAASIAAVIGKTEGNGGANDFTRALATLRVTALLGECLDMAPEEVTGRVALVWSGGCEGVLSPHMTVFTRQGPAPEGPRASAGKDAGRDGAGAGAVGGEVQDAGRPGLLAIAVQRTRSLLPEEIGRMSEVREVVAAVRSALSDISVTADAVHYVQVKGPLLTPAGIADADRRGQEVVTRDPNRSKAFARGATALGVAIALGEVAEDQVSDSTIANDMSLYSAVASTSAGGELTDCEVVLFANSPYATSEYRIGHGCLRDAADADGARDALRAAGLRFGFSPDRDAQRRVAAVFAKAEAPVGGMLRGYRTTMLSDADINYERHARAAVGAVITSVTGDPRIFVSGGTEHQGPPGQAPIAAIVRTEGT